MVLMLLMLCNHGARQLTSPRCGGQVQQIRGEQQVEQIIRSRSLMLFFSRCRGFVPSES